MENREKKRDYQITELYEFEDRRLRRIDKEARFAWYFVSGYTLCCFLAYLLLPSFEKIQGKYILGMPVWFVLCSLVSAVAIVIMLIYTVKFSKCFSLEAKEEEV